MIKRVGTALSLVVCSAFAEASDVKRNVLFIAVDDLRTELGCYGHPLVKSPNIDQLASESMRFNRAYCQIAVCGPSRLSLMTGVHPDTIGVYGMQEQGEWRDTRKGFVSLPQQFRKYGWMAVGYGKVYDVRLGVDVGYSWDAYDQGRKPHFVIPAHMDQFWKSRKSKIVHMPVVECADVPDKTYTGGHITDMAVEFLEQHDMSKPLFLAVGFEKPHLPFVAPKKYWDLYKRADIRLPEIRQPLRGFSKYTLSNYKEILDYDVTDPNHDETARRLMHGYYACVSYVDAQVGRLIAALKDKGIYDNTLIVLWGDHGWKLGEYGAWGKLTNLEVDARVPLIIKLPGFSPKVTDSLVEFTDVLPTLCEAAGLPVPATAEGYSLIPVLRDSTASVRDFALTQYPRGVRIMGYSIRTDRWRYTEWQDVRNRTVLARELYNLFDEIIETENVITHYPKEADALQARLHLYLKNSKKWVGPGAGP